MLDPTPYRITPPRPWRPLEDAEMAVLAPYFAHPGGGRPLHDLRGRLNAIFWVACHRGRWADLPAELGPWDTAHRQFRRWVHRGIWSRLLVAVAARRAPAALKRLEHWLCRAFRRALRILGMAGIRLVRRLRLASALKGPYWMYPDPNLSEALLPLVMRRMEGCIGPDGWPDLALIDAVKSFHTLCGGRRWIPSCLALP